MHGEHRVEEARPWQYLGHGLDLLGNLLEVLCAHLGLLGKLGVLGLVSEEVVAVRERRDEGLPERRDHHDERGTQVHREDLVRLGGVFADL